MSATPTVDVNLLVHNGAATIGAAIESVLAQTWPALTLTVLDNASGDGTQEVVRGYMRSLPRIRLVAARVDAGGLANCERAFTVGEADFVLPKTADDLLAPDFVEKTMGVMLAHPDCAMCHAGGLVFAGEGRVQSVYPAAHRLHAVGADPIERARHVMARYTSAPSFWGVYRRDAVARLARFRYSPGWDHPLLAELALYGEIRHVPELLYLRRGGGKPVLLIARACAEAAQRGLPLDEPLGELRWMTPLIATAYAHVERFAVADAEAPVRAALMAEAPRVFRARWRGRLEQEAGAFLSVLPRLAREAEAMPDALGTWRRHQIGEVLAGIEAILPEMAMPASRAPAAA
jgi:hypothetical protein